MPIEDRANGVDEGLRIEWFADEGLRSLAESDLTVAGTDGPADVNHREAASPLREPQTLVQLQSGEVRHVNVQEKNVWSFAQGDV